MSSGRLLAPASLLYDANLDFLNTLGVTARAHCLAEVNSVDELQQTLGWWQKDNPRQPILVLGGGSNLVFAEDFPGLVIRMLLRGREVIEESPEYVWLQIGAGENWHELVEHCQNFHLWGLENQALIPGTVGAAPIQNIGAYGVELQDCFAELAATEISSGVSVTFDRTACLFGYRDSVFKHDLRDRYIITSVTLRLRKQPRPVFDYPALRQYFEAAGIQSPSPQQIFLAVCEIRQSKLPDPRQIPNAGSFFHNPVVDMATWTRLQKAHPGIVGYPHKTGQGDATAMKLAAGWLIDQAGWRGFREGAVGVHQHQALVLINPGRGPGREVLALADRIRADIQARFGVKLVIEPTVVP